MKNATIFLLTFATFFSVAFGQSLFTKTGTDLTWAQVKAQDKIPTSGGGLTGSDIDVNQDHALISSSPYANRSIQNNIAIHTIANSTVPRSNFNKWTRWYQEDGNTQVFRMFKGEINVGNDIYYKPRIEAELQAHSKGLNINNGADWVEWSGTYTFVKPVEANIFQIWSSDDYVLMLNMKNSGQVQLNPRDQSGFKTILSNGTGKSVHIRVRDYGNKYEVYVDGKYFYGRSYAAKYGNSRAAHFRWGIYASRKKGDFGGVPQDGMMFVTGARRIFSNDDVQDPDPIITGPEGYTYNTDENKTITISNTPYDIAYGVDGKFVYLENQTDDVTCSNDKFGSDPIPGTKKYCFIRESKMPYQMTPTVIPGTLEMENFDFGGAGRSYMDTDVENNGNLDFRKNNEVDIDEGSDGNGYAIGWIRKGEWLEYTVDIAKSGEYDMKVTYSSKNGGGSIGLDLDGSNMVSGISIPATDGWDSYDDLTESVNLTAGKHVLRVNMEEAGFNLDKLEFAEATVTNTSNLEISSSLQIFPNPSIEGVFNLTNATNWTVFRSSGTLVKTGEGNVVDLSKEPKSIYLLKIDNKFLKLIKQ